MKIFDVHNKIWEVHFSSFYSIVSGLFSTFIWLSVSLYSGNWFLFFVPTGATRFCSVPTRFIVYYVRNFDGCVQSFSLNHQLKKPKRNDTEQKNPYCKNVLIEALIKKDKKSKKAYLFLIFPVVFLCFT